MAGDAVVSSKPQLRNLHQAVVKRNVGVALVLCLTGAAAFKYLYCEPRKQKVAEFYKNYDANAAFERMKKAGIFQSVPADS